jgi:hypothetical protein
MSSSPHAVFVSLSRAIERARVAFQLSHLHAAGNAGRRARLCDRRAGRAFARARRRQETKMRPRWSNPWVDGDPSDPFLALLFGLMACAALAAVMFLLG